MSGSSTIPRFEIPQGFTITVPGPLDDRTKISSISNLDVELPSGVRYLGMPLIWVDDENKYYLFSGGITNDKLISLSDYLQFGTGEIVSIAFTYDNPILAGSITTLTHNLNSTNLHVTIYDGREPLLVDWYIPEFEGGSNSNQISIKNDVTINNMRVVLAFVQTLVNNPSSFVPSDEVKTFSIKSLTSTGAVQKSILANTRILSIDYRFVSGTPTVKCGTTLGGSEIHETVSIVNGEDTNILIMKTYSASRILYFTIADGILDFNINVNENAF